MGTIYRSEIMSLCQVFLQTDSAYQCVAELGELGKAQFRDLNEELNPYQKKFVNEVKRCEDMERKLNFIREEVEKDEIPIPDIREHVPSPMPRHMFQLEADFDKLDEELRSINQNTKVLTKNHVQLLEMKAVLERVKHLLDGPTKREAAMSISEAARGEAGPFTIGLKPDFDKEARRDDTELKFVTGVISRDKVLSFEKTMWRMCRGKVFLRTMDVTEQTDFFMKQSGPNNGKAVFILFFSGEQLRVRVKKICSAYHAVIYNCPDSQAERQLLLDQIHTQAEDMKAVISRTLDYRGKIINAAALNIAMWNIQLIKLKSIFHTLNMFSVDVTQKCLIAECWVPTDDIHLVRDALKRGVDQSGSHVHAVLNEMDTHRTPPTYFRLNKFTQGFQNIVDAYGIANYREVNPAPWTIISFPFLFAVMFGDSGHGIIMLIAASAFLIYEKKIVDAKIKDEIFNTFFGGRYVVFLMSLFSIYTGLLYNDIYSKSIDIFGSAWQVPNGYTDVGLERIMNLTALSSEGGNKEADLTYAPEDSFNTTAGPYPFGVDPIWNFSINKLNFLNPMKMKTSILLGVGQMFFGLMISLCNYIHKRSIVDTVFVFIPQVLFLGCIFVYLCVQIVLKWVLVWVKPKILWGNYLYPGSYCAPSLLIGLINMFMKKVRDPGFVEILDPSKKYNGSSIISNVTIIGDDGNNKTYTYVMYDQCFQQQWYPNQDMIELILLLIALISIPVMLLVKPFYIRWRHNKGLPVDLGHGDEDDDSHEFNFGDVLVYQAIHTIEFALGCISHTASYLRLWALSLAHAQLSEVLWQMLLRIALKMGGWGGAVAIFFIWFVFAFLSICILILMEGLSAFLHAIRLHWVEFNSKFYGGGGHEFQPFWFYKIIRISEGLEQ